MAPNRGAIVAELLEVAAELGFTPASVALRWLLEKPAVASIILGARTASQFKVNLATSS
nr:aldo/keto reductase [Ancylobacter defluvii]